MKQGAKISWSKGIESVCNVGDVGSIPGSGRSPGGGNGNSLHYSCLGNMDGGAWHAIIHGVTKSQTLLSMQAKKTQNIKPRRGHFPSIF